MQRVQRAGVQRRQAVAVDTEQAGDVGAVLAVELDAEPDRLDRIRGRSAASAAAT